MNFNLKMTAVAVALISAVGAANAAPTTGANGSLLIGAFNTVTNAYYIRDTGLLLNSFLPSSVTTLSGDGGVTGNKTPAAGLTINKASSGYTNFGDASVSTWLTGQTQNDIRWFLSAVDSSGTATATDVKRFITTSTNTAESATNGNLDGYISSANAGGIATLYTSGTNGANVSTGNDLASAAAAWTTNFGLFTSGEDSHAKIGSAASLFYFARSTGTASTTTAATGTRYGNADKFATFTLAANGDLTYALAAQTATPSAVPVPAAAWLLGSGLLTMGAFMRRRKA